MTCTTLLLLLSIVAYYCCCNVATVNAFVSDSMQLRTIHTSLNAKSRKARRQVTKSRPQSFYDAIDDANGKTKEKPTSDSDSTAAPAVTASDQRARDAQERMQKRPEVSTMIVDDELGTQVVVQGQNVLDVVTRKAVKLYNSGSAEATAQFRLAQMFPGVPSEMREKYRFSGDKRILATTIVQELQKVCLVKGSIPAHPSISNKALDFCTANRDLLGQRMKRTLGRIAMRAAWKEQAGQPTDGMTAKEAQQLWKHYLTIENYLSAPFRQMMLDGEGRVGPNFGNLDIQSYADGALYERCANYLVLKGMVAHWEKKVLDAEYIEKTPQTPENYIRVLSRGDPKRYLPDPPILFTLRECAQVAGMAQKMTKIFCETPSLFDDLPPEVRFIEKALTIKGGTLLRQYMVEDFCPNENITPEGLREGMRRLIAQLDNMQIDPYADIVNILERLHKAMAVGSDDEYDPYTEYLSNNKDGPGYFQTYTFNHENLSRVRFLDASYDGGSSASNRPKGEGGFGGLGKLFGLGGGGSNDDAEVMPTIKKDEEDTYKVPDVRAIGRPHNLGWLELLNESNSVTIDSDSDSAASPAVNDDDSMQFGKVPAGRIIPDNET